MSRRKPAAGPALPAHPDALCVIVYRGTDALYVLDEGERVLAPATMRERAPVALALAQASATLANLPVPETYPERLRAVADRLCAVGTPAACEVLEALEAATHQHVAAYEAALALLDAAAPVVH